MFLKNDEKLKSRKTVFGSYSAPESNQANFHVVVDPYSKFHQNLLCVTNRQPI